MWPRVRFVDAPDVTANVRFDFHDRLTGTARTSLLADDYSIGAPALEGDPDAEAVQYGARTLRFTLVVEGPRSAARAKQAAVAREMLRRDNWIQFQLDDDTEPVWFKLYRAEPGELSFDHFRNSHSQDEWHIGMSLPAEAFAWGARITLPAVVLTNNPAAPSNGSFTVLPDIVGDAPAPARVRFRYTLAQTGNRHLLACSPAPGTYDAPVWWQVGTGDDWTLGADTSAAASDVDYIGGTYRAVSFATDAAMATRISGDAPAPIAPGRYKVMGRVIRSDTDSTFATRFGVTTGFTYVYGDTIPLSWGVSAAEHAAWVDLGEFRFPQGNPLIDLTDEPAVTPDIAWQAQRLTGDGSLRLNALLLIPISDDNARTLFVDYAGLAPAASFDDEYHDGELDVVYSRRPLGGDRLSSMDPPNLEGGFAVLTPGEQNVLHWVEQASTTRAATFFGDCPDRITSSASLVVSYHPQHLWIGGS